MVKKSVALVAFNNIIVSPIFIYIGGVLDNFEPKHTLAVEDLPNKFTFAW